MESRYSYSIHFNHEEPWVVGGCRRHSGPSRGAAGAAGTAAGFTGLFGYVGGALCAELIIGAIADSYGWDACFILLIVSSILAIGIMAFTLKRKVVTG